MIAIYVVALIIGGALIVMSALGVGHGHDADTGADFHADHDAHFDAGHDAHFDAHGHEVHDQGQEQWLPFLSLRFWTYLFAVAGAIGFLLTYFGGGITEPAIGLTAGITGVAAGTAVAYTMRSLRKSEADSSMKIQDLMGKMGKVTVGIGEKQPGRIRCELKGEILDLLALPEGLEALPIGTEVVIVSMENGTAKVIPRDVIFGETEASV